MGKRPYHIQKTLSARPTIKQITGGKKGLGSQEQRKTVYGQKPEKVLNVSPTKTAVSTFKHSSFESFVTDIITESNVDIQRFTAGNIGKYHQQWASLTSDHEILNIVRGKSLVRLPRVLPFSDKEAEVIDGEIEKLLQMGVLTQYACEKDDFLSNIFIRPKQDVKYRMILNLKPFNQYLQYHHFKMDTLKTAVAMVRPHCYMASIDLKDAYYSVPIKETHQKYLKFQWRDTYYKYTCFANGLAPCPRKFTKLLKPVCAMLRRQGHEIIG